MYSLAELLELCEEVSLRSWGYYRKFYLGDREDLTGAAQVAVIEWADGKTEGLCEVEAGKVIDRALAREVAGHPKGTQAAPVRDEETGEEKDPTQFWVDPDYPIDPDLRGALTEILWAKEMRHRKTFRFEVTDFQRRVLHHLLVLKQPVEEIAARFGVRASKIRVSLRGVCKTVAREFGDSAEPLTKLLLGGPK